MHNKMQSYLQCTAPQSSRFEVNGIEGPENKDTNPSNYSKRRVSWGMKCVADLSL